MHRYRCLCGNRLAAKGTALGDRKCTSKLAYLEELIDRYYLGDKDEEKLQEGLYAGLLYGLDDPYSRYYTAEEYDSENSSNEGSYVGDRHSYGERTKKAE